MYITKQASEVQYTVVVSEAQLVLISNAILTAWFETEDDSDDEAILGQFLDIAGPFVEPVDERF